MFVRPRVFTSSDGHKRKAVTMRRSIQDAMAIAAVAPIDHIMPMRHAALSFSQFIDEISNVFLSPDTPQTNYVTKNHITNST